jgi:hypothetical protein
VRRAPCGPRRREGPMMPHSNPNPSGGEPGTTPRPPQPPSLPVLPYILLGLMTLATFAGPFVIYASILGGDSGNWPPDRPVEWWVFGVVTGSVAALMGACVTVGLWSKPRGRS